MLKRKNKKEMLKFQFGYITNGSDKIADVSKQITLLASSGNLVEFEMAGVIYQSSPLIYHQIVLAGKKNKPSVTRRFATMARNANRATRNYVKQVKGCSSCGNK